MVKAILLACFALLGAAAVAEPTLVVIVDVNCPFCRELHATDGPIKVEAKKAGVSFTYAPIPGDGDFDNAWAEKTFYACTKNTRCDSDKLLTALYDSQDAQKLTTHADVTVWLDTVMPSPLINNLVTNEAVKDENARSLYRAARLAHAVKISQFPTFAVVGDGDLPPYQLASQKDAPLVSRVREVMQWLKTKQDN